MTDHPNLAIGRAATDAAAPRTPDLIDASLGILAPNTARRIYEQIWGASTRTRPSDYATGP